MDELLEKKATVDGYFNFKKKRKIQKRIHTHKTHIQHVLTPKKQFPEILKTNKKLTFTCLSPI